MSVSQSMFKFFAQTSPGLEKILIQELKGFGLKAQLRNDISHVQFQANYETIFRILHESRTIESLKIQIGNEIKARSEEELEKNIQKLPWAAFLPIQDLYKYNQPQITCKSYRSNLFHEKLITGIVEKQMNLLNVKKEYKALNQLSGGQHARNKSLNKAIKERKKLIDERKDIIIQNRELQKKSDENNELANIPQLPDINVYLVKDRATILMKLHLDSLHKHALKEKVGWAPIKEGIVAGSLIQIDYKQKFSKELKIWDPFCGSGSIVLELLSMMFQQKIRNKFDLFFLKNFPEEQYQKYLESDVINNDMHQENQNAEQMDNIQELDQESNSGKSEQKYTNNGFLTNGMNNISIIASDISNQAIQYSIDNFHHSQLEDTINDFIQSRQEVNQDLNQEKSNSNQSPTPEVNDQNQDLVFTQNISNNSSNSQVTQNEKNNEQNNKLNQLAPFYIKETFCDERVRFIRSDFEALSKLINLRGYTIITNLPYGVRSAEHISDQELTNSFKRFAKVIRKNLTKLQDVYVYTTVHEKYYKEHFINISGMVWTIKQKYSLGGLQIGLFELNKEASLTSSQYQVVDEQKIIEEEKRLQLIEKKLSKSPQDDEISKQLRQIIGDRSELATMSAQEKNEYNRKKEQKENLQTLRKAAEIVPAIEKALDKRSHTARQIKSITIRKKVEYAKALKLRSLMQKSKFVENLNQKEVQRRIESKRNRNNTEFIKSVMESVGVEVKEDALSQIQEKLDVTAGKKKEKRETVTKKKENKTKIPRWY